VLSKKVLNFALFRNDFFEENARNINGKTINDLLIKHSQNG